VWSVGCGALLGGITAVFSPVIAGWFTDDKAVLDLLVAGLWWVGLSQPLNGVAFALDGILVGAGDQRYLAVAMVGSLGVMALGAAIISRPAVDLRGLWLLLIAFMASRVVLLGVRYRTDRWLHMGSGLPPATPWAGRPVRRTP